MIKFETEIQLILDKEEFMEIIDIFESAIFESAITLSDNQLDMWEELESFMLDQNFFIDG